MEPGAEHQVCRKVYRRLQQELAIGSLGLRRAPGHVGAAGVGPDVDSQLRVPGAQAPAIGDSIIGGQLPSVGLAVLPVADDDGVGGWRADLLPPAESRGTACERS